MNAKGSQESGKNVGWSSTRRTEGVLASRKAVAQGNTVGF